MRNKIFIGIILVLLGLLVLLVNLGYFNYNVLFNVIKLWPLILIAIGISLIFKNHQVVSYITWGLVILIMIVYGVFGKGDSIQTIDSKDYIVIEKLPETKYGQLDLDLGAAKISLDSTNDKLLGLDLVGRELDYKENYKNKNETAIIDIEAKHFRITRPQNHKANYDIFLNENTIWDLNINMGAVSAYMDLENIPARNIEVDSGAAELTFNLGNKHDLDFYIDTGASDLTFIFPQDVGLKIKMDIALSSTNIGDLNLTRQGDYYVSANYDSAHTLINLDIDMGLGAIKFSYR